MFEINACDMASYSQFVSAEDICVFDELDSTNNYAKKLASEGAKAGTAVIAHHQTAGRGRMGRSFESPAGSGIYMSVILRPGDDFADAVFVTSAAAVAVCRSIRRLTGKDAGIKWVNDIYKEKKKICGILTEAVPDPENAKLDCVIVGIGINFLKPERNKIEAMPADVQERIGWIYDEHETPSVTASQLAASVVDEVIEICRDLSDRAFIEEYKKNSIILGEKIVFISGGKKQSAFALDIDKTGALVVKMPDNTQKTLSSGEISVRWTD